MLSSTVFTSAASYCSSVILVYGACWRGQAMNVAESVRKGQPVVVYGRYYSRDYTKNEQVRTSYELEAAALGHDLSRGVSAFTRKNRTAPPVVIEVDENGRPADDSDHWLGLADSTEKRTGTLVDAQTGEVLSAPADEKHERQLASV